MTLLIKTVIVDVQEQYQNSNYDEDTKQTYY